MNIISISIKEIYYKKGIFLGILIFLINTVSGQNIKIFDQPLTSNTEELSQNTIILKPGFCTQGYSFSAKTIPSDTKSIPLEEVLLPDDMNYDYTVVPKVPLTDISEATYLGDISRYVEIYDGLGRPTQSIVFDGSPTGKDVIIPVYYDQDGRTTRSYLPYVTNASNTIDDVRNDWLQEQQYFYKSFPDFSSNNDYLSAYSEVDVEKSPFQRLQEYTQPGNDWKIQKDAQGGHTEKYEYYPYYGTMNRYTYNYGDYKTATSYSIVTNGYSSKTLYYNKITDANNHIQEQFTDKTGKNVCTRTYLEDGTTVATYNVYDDFGRLRCIVSPKANGVITGNTELCYFYDYDEYGRVIKEKKPGENESYLVYGKEGNPVMVQNAALRESSSSKNWAFTKYDALGRPVFMGVMEAESGGTAISFSTIRSDFKNRTGLSSSFYETEVSSGTIGYTLNNSYPSLYSIAESEINQVIYYDDYLITGQNYGLTWYNTNLKDAVNFPSNSVDFRTNGLPTGSKTRVLDQTGNLLLSLAYYDRYGRAIALYQQNQLNGFDKVLMEYSFSGQVLKAKHIQQVVINSQTVTTTEWYTYDYDHTGRLLKIYHHIGDTYEQGIVLTSNNYNELGQLVEENLHSADNGNTFQQSVDFKFNIRGWLTNINNAALNGSGINLNDTQTDLFGMEINYTQAVGDFAANYDGKITSVDWNKSGDAAIKRYAYTYDNLGRLTNEIMGDTHNIPQLAAPGAYSTTGIAYDLNGNITDLTRYNASGVATRQRYSYLVGTNKLLNVTFDGSSPGAGITKQYRTNGALKSDSHKSISDIAYNQFNLTTAITFTSTNKLSFTYSGAGALLRRSKINSSSQVEQRTDYVSNMVYVTDAAGTTTLDYMSMPFGRVVLTSNQWVYEYQLKDHLGNTRVAFVPGETAPVVVQKIDYYAFGLMHEPVALQNDNTYRYNGKEQYDDYGLNWYNYGARMYDPELGVWHAPDAMSAYMPGISPYAYCFNNPISFTDPDGNHPKDNGCINRRPLKAKIENKIAQIKSDVNKAIGKFSEAVSKGVEYVQEQRETSSSTMSEEYNEYLELPEFGPDEEEQRAIAQAQARYDASTKEEQRVASERWQSYCEERRQNSTNRAEAKVAGYGLTGAPSMASGNEMCYGCPPPEESANGGGGNGIISGQSIDATLAIASLGWTIEGGYYADSKNVEQFVSNGYTVGVEASVGYNLIIIKPKANFKFSDLEGMGTSGVINIGMISIGILGNSAPGYPENSVFETYWGIKIGIGAGAGGSYTPKSNTTFFDWIPDITKSSFHWK